MIYLCTEWKLNSELFRLALKGLWPWFRRAFKCVLINGTHISMLPWTQARILSWAAPRALADCPSWGPHPAHGWPTGVCTESLPSCESFSVLAFTWILLWWNAERENFALMRSCWYSLVFPLPPSPNPFRIALIKSRYPMILEISPNKVFYKAKRAVFAVSRAGADGELCIP